MTEYPSSGTAVTQTIVYGLKIKLTIPIVSVPWCVYVGKSGKLNSIAF